METLREIDNHSVAYCLLGYLCAYYRYYYPMEFITAFLNNSQNDDDIENGTELMNIYDIKISNPKWGISRGDFFFDKETKIIYKGLSSVKYMGEAVSEELYQLSQTKKYETFIELLLDIENFTSLDSRQIDLLVKIEFFSEFGNQRELLRIIDMFKFFKEGNAKQIAKTKVDGSPFEAIVKRHAVGVTKSGNEAKSYTLLDVKAILLEIEEFIKSMNVNDLDDIIKVKNFISIMGYPGYTSGKPEDRRKLYIKNIYPISRKKDGKQFGYSVLTKSIGSGVDGRFTVFNRIYDKNPINEGEIIYCKKFERDGAYFVLKEYEKIF